jgi:hypothetical protein
MTDVSKGLTHLALSDEEWTRITKCVAILQVRNNIPSTHYHSSLTDTAVSCFGFAGNVL